MTIAAPARGAPAHGDAPRQLQCMEVWGGNRAIESALSVPGIDAWVYSYPLHGSSAGGDIHYVSTCGGGNIARFTVADVAGHGDTVSDLAVTLRKLMRRYINTLNQTRFVRALNREFSQVSLDGSFATALIVTYFAPTDHLVVCNAGHPPPLWYHSQTGTWRQLEHTSPECVGELSNLPLGVIEPTDFHQFAAPLGVGDLVLVYTDALIESADSSGRQLGQAGLLELVRGIRRDDPSRFGPVLLDAVAEYRGGVPAEDDTTLIVLRHNAADPPRQSMGEMVRVIGKMLHLIPV